MPLSSFQLQELGLAPYWKQRPANTSHEAQHTPDASAHNAPIDQTDALPQASPIVPADCTQTAVAQLDWPQLQARVQSCTLCGLCETRTQTVFGTGYRQADWLFIGEAPGAQEDRQGEPFVGQAGKLLNNMLHAIGLTRADEPSENKEGIAHSAAEKAAPSRQKTAGKQSIYIANILKCRPPGNRDPLPEEVAQCEPYLQRQLALIRPKLIIALGRIAAQSLLKTKATISSLRGQVHHYEGIPLIVTYHPAYLLRNLPDKAKAWADLCLAREVESTLR